MCTLFCPHPLLFPTPPHSRRLSHSFILSFFLFPFPFVSRRLSQFQSSPALSISSLSFFFFYQNSFSSLSFSRTLFRLFLLLFLLLFLFFTVTSLIETEIEISLYGSYSSNVPNSFLENLGISTLMLKEYFCHRWYHPKLQI